MPRYCSQNCPFRMADGADDRRVRDQLKVLTGLKLPGFNWNANNMRMEFDIFWGTLSFVLDGMDIPKDKWYLYILQQLGREGMQHWTTSIEATVRKEDPLAIIKAFKKGYELEETYWMYRSLYLSSEKQGRGEMAAAPTTRVEDLVSMCKWPDDLYYHLSEVFDVRCFVQLETSREGGNLTWEKLVEEAKRQECVGKEYAKFRRENGGSGTPSYGDSALAADTISRGYNRPQPRSRTPSGGKGGKSQKQCDRCGRRNGCTGERGTCPAWGKECGICRGKNHYKAVCWKAAQMQAGGGQPKFQKQGKGKSPGKNGKAKAKHAHSVVFKTVPSAKGIVSRLEERASNSVTSEPSVSLSLGVQRVNSVLSAGNRQSKASLHTCNVFSCDSIHNTGIAH